MCALSLCPCNHPALWNNVSRFTSSNDLLNCGTSRLLYKIVDDKGPGSPRDSQQDPRNPHRHAALKSWRDRTLALRPITTPTYSIEKNSVLADSVQFMRCFPGCLMR